MFYFLILVVLIALALGHRESKPIFYILYSLLFIISVGTQGGYDISNYEIAFDSPLAASDSEDRSFVFDSYMIFLKGLGFTFQQLRIINFALWSIPIFAIIIRYCKYPSYVLALCFLFPILSFSSQMRNGVAMSFLFWGIYLYIYKRNSIIGKICYLLGLSLACIIHSMTFVYIAGVIAFSKRISTGLLFRISSIIALVFAFFISTGFLYDIVALIFSEYYANFYFSNVEPFVFGNINVFIGIVINIWFLFQAERVEKRFMEEDNGLRWELTNFILRLNILLLAISPLMLISLSFYRIYQNIFFFSVICVANASAHNYLRSKSLSNIYILFFYIVTFFYIYSQGTFLEGWDGISL